MGEYWKQVDKGIKILSKVLKPNQFDKAIVLKILSLRVYASVPDPTLPDTHTC